MPLSPSARVLRCALLATLCAASAPTYVHAQRPLNLDFEMPSVADSTLPWGWSLGWSAFAGGPAALFALDSKQSMQGERSLRISASDTTANAPARGLLLQLPSSFAIGRRLTLTGYLRTEGVGVRALLTLEAWGNRVVLAADTATLSGSGAPHGWQRVAVSITVPRDPSIHSVVLMPAMQGAGTAWFDGLTLSRDGEGLDRLPGVASPTRAQLGWLAARSSPLRTVSPPETSPPNDYDLARFDDIVGQARVVGLGESTHGTREFFQVKHRLVEHLVRTQGFTVFALEANQRAVAKLDAYVRVGTGTAREALRSVFLVWNTEEMLALVSWMRAYNISHPKRPIGVVGFDMQDQHEPADSLLAFLAQMDPALHASVDARTKPYRAAASFATPQVDAATRATWLVEAESLVVAVNGRRSVWLDAARSHADSLRVEWALHDADLYQQAARLNASLASPDRDSLMAANLDWILRTLHPRARAVVWAHDVHVSHGGDKRRSFNGGTQLGTYIKHAYAHDYRAFSLLTREGTYSATRSFTDPRVIEAPAFPAPEGSVEAMLGALPRPLGSAGAIVDLRVREDDALGAWLWEPRPVRHIGFAAYDYGFEMLGVMPLDFDGIVFVDRSGASRPWR